MNDEVHEIFQKPYARNPHVQQREFEDRNREDYVAVQVYFIRRALERIADILESAHGPPVKRD